MSRTWLKLVQEPPQDPMCSLKYKSEPDQLFHHWNFHTERFARKTYWKTSLWTFCICCRRYSRCCQGEEKETSQPSARNSSLNLFQETTQRNWISDSASKLKSLPNVELVFDFTCEAGSKRRSVTRLNSNCLIWINCDNNNYLPDKNTDKEIEQRAQCHVHGQVAIPRIFIFLHILSQIQGRLSKIIVLPLILRNSVLNSSSGDGQKEDGSQGKRDVHGQGNSQLTKWSYENYFRTSDWRTNPK